MIKITRQMLKDGTAVRGKTGIPPMNLCEAMKKNICSKIIGLVHKKDLPKEKLANILDMTDSQVMKMLAYHIEFFSLDFLVEKLEWLSKYSAEAQTSVRRLKVA